ncbi:MAG: CoA pyrophosphatase [Myxococcota bacterium]|nr:CoA pyrophosphatase [Myxococcota bacterium]
MDLEPGGYDERLRTLAVERLARFERRAEPLADRRAAAVALVLVPDDAGRPCFVLTRRAPRLNRHAGQWALPGGRTDPGESAQEAALRELEEEVSLRVAPDAVLGLLDDYPTRSGYVITPVVVWGGVAPELRPDPAEVAEIHRVPLEHLERPGVPRLRAIPESERPVISIPIVGTQVHAPTAAIVYQLREVVVRGEATRVAHYEQPVFAWR